MAGKKGPTQKELGPFAASPIVFETFPTTTVAFRAFVIETSPPKKWFKIRSFTTALLSGRASHPPLPSFRSVYQPPLPSFRSGRP